MSLSSVRAWNATVSNSIRRPPVPLKPDHAHHSCYRRASPLQGLRGDDLPKPDRLVRREQTGADTGSVRQLCLDREAFPLPIMTHSLVRTVFLSFLAIPLVILSGCQSPAGERQAEMDAWMFSKEWVSQDRCFDTCLAESYEDDGKTQVFDPCVCWRACSPNDPHPPFCYKKPLTFEEYKALTVPPSFR